MRKLTSKQQNFLKNILESRGCIYSVDRLTASEIKKLEFMNDYETLWQDSNRFIMDYRMENASFRRKSYLRTL